MTILIISRLKGLISKVTCPKCALSCYSCSYFTIYYLVYKMSQKCPEPKVMPSNCYLYQTSVSPNPFRDSSGKKLTSKSLHWRRWNQQFDSFALQKHKLAWNILYLIKQLLQLYLLLMQCKDLLCFTFRFLTKTWRHHPGLVNCSVFFFLLFSDIEWTKQLVS